MTRHHSSRPDHWTLPRPVQDASMRFRTHGKVQPMEPTPGIFARLFGKARND